MAKVTSANDTIAAIATPMGQGALGIVRLSGKDSIGIADRVFCPKKGKGLCRMKTFSLKYGWIVRDREKFEKSGRDLKTAGDEVLDEVLVSLMLGPASYTREDVVEISSHGGPRVLCAILELLVEKGARLAEPGEFTRRAFLNGRIDLAQAEAVLDIIQAKSDMALKNSLEQLQGMLSVVFRGLRSRLIEIVSDMEASLDFSEEEPSGISAADLRSRIEGACRDMKELLEGSLKGRIIREGLKAAIYGRPNTGKSSLLNALLKIERAIVTPIAGTTRDTIEEYLNIRGLGVCLIDTAGILEARDAIESSAVARAAQAMEGSDLVLFVIDGSAAITEHDTDLFKKINSGKKIIIVINKSDLPAGTGIKQAKEAFGAYPVVEVSALKGENLGRLEDEIIKAAFSSSAAFEHALISNTRHINIISDSLQSLQEALAAIDKGLSFEFSCVDVRKALDRLGELTGEVFNEELLDSIFSRFCIGK